MIQRAMGSDAHTAGLLPGEPFNDRQKIAAAVYVEKLSRWRVTLSPGVLLATRQPTTWLLDQAAAKLLTD